ncbi:hypothetical protein [Paraburkholderia sp. BCC1886]|uniref:hypothetical protein n=1 Tax=Paraburkholderia sp. BCC1886 TaxID=2562670 RepID=UPI00118265EF|nr:hypothetical protein [Paraburkholderia sp. BCC1886]
MSVQDALSRVIGLFGPQATWDPTKLYGNLTVSPNGNILIGTSTDDGINKLQVNGTTRLGGSGLILPDGSQQYSGAAGKNKAINGDCRVQQYAASVAFASNSGTAYGGVDRFLAGNVGATGGAFTQAAGTIVFGSVSYPAVVQTVTTPPTVLSGTNYLTGINHYIEGFNSYEVQGGVISVRFLFSAKVAGIYSFTLCDYAGKYSYVTTFSAVAGAQQIMLQNLPIPATLGLGANATTALCVIIGFVNLGSYLTTTLNAWQTGIYRCASNATNWTAVAGNFIALSDLQVEAGPVCTPVERKIYSDALLDCQRYYEVVYTLIEYGYANAGNVFGFTFPFKVMKRIAPVFKSGTFATSNCSASVVTTTIDAFQVNPTITATGPFGFTGATAFAFSAEL